MVTTSRPPGDSPPPYTTLDIPDWLTSHPPTPAFRVDVDTPTTREAAVCMPNFQPPSADSYAMSPIEGTQVIRVAGGEPNQLPGFAVRCACGFKAGEYVGAEIAEYVRTEHESACLWPKP